MIKLLIISDDFTGALDTGVQFSACGIKTKVVTRPDFDFEALDAKVQVLVVDAETRHISPQKAYKVVYEISRKAVESNVPYIYKKTDSALRGNVGMELAAVLAASGQGQLDFFPAFPQMNRITMDGIHYIDGQPVDKTPFGQDPFNPVSCSYVPQLICQQCETVSVTTAKPIDVGEGIPKEQGIIVWDSESFCQMEETGQALAKQGRLHVMAGCAGFAQALPDLLKIEGKTVTLPRLNPDFLVVCGSVHPVTGAQMDYAQQHGFCRVKLTAQQKLEAGYWCKDAGREDLEQLYDMFRQKGTCILESNDEPGSNATMDYANQVGMSLENVRAAIPKALAAVVEGLWQRGLNSTVLLTGGDTLLAVMDQIHVWEMEPICEMAPGTVLAAFQQGDNTRYVLTKSGGFGQPELFVELAKQCARTDKKQN